MFLLYDYCHNSEQDVVDTITAQVTWGDQLIANVTHSQGQVFNIETTGATYSYDAPECDFHGHYPPLFPFGPEYLAVLFVMSMLPLTLAWIMTVLRRLT